jgi:hydroxylamine dehydrogenase
MRKSTYVLSAFLVASGLALSARAAQTNPSKVCIDCHAQTTPGAVSDWQLSKHQKERVGCVDCHGDGHTRRDDVARAHLPTAETCGLCHAKHMEEHEAGKHGVAWAAMKAMPTFHHQPVAMTDGMKGCGGCHKIGNKSEAEIKDLKKTSGGYGVAACDSCHTRHTFSVAEAKSPQACETCHMGFDHPQWEMYASSKHGVRNNLKQMKILPAGAVAPTCQTCHMQGGNHEVNTAWGFLAVRLPLPEDKPWAADRTTILQALGVLDPAGKPTGRLEVVKAANVARLTQEDWQKQRDKMLVTCTQCHAGNFAKEQLGKGDDMIKQADHLMAEAIRTVATLYKDGVLAKPKAYASAFPDLLTFHDSPTVIEQRLFVMYFEHRMRAFQGTFHASPDYALWYGWSEMKCDLTEINELADNLRRTAHK